MSLGWSHITKWKWEFDGILMYSRIQSCCFSLNLNWCESSPKSGGQKIREFAQPNQLPNFPNHLSWLFLTVVSPECIFSSSRNFFHFSFYPWCLPFYKPRYFHLCSLYFTFYTLGQDTWFMPIHEERPYRSMVKYTRCRSLCLICRIYLVSGG